MVAGDRGKVVSSSLAFAWDVSPRREEPWRRFLQELSDPRYEEYARSRRRLGFSAVSVWLAPKPSRERVAIVYLESSDPERALGELAASDTPFDSWYGTQIRRLFGLDLARSEQVAGGELLFAWRNDGRGEHDVPEDSG